MCVYKMIYVLITLASVGAVVALPDNVLCCTPGMGTFRTTNDEPFCWDEKKNKTSEVTLQKTCETNKTDAISEHLINFTITDAGEAFYSFKGSRSYVDQGTFCAGNQTAIDENGTSVTVRYLVFCYEDNEAKQQKQVILSYCSIVSIIFLAITAVIYAALPEIRDLQGKSIVNFCSSLAFGYLWLAIINLAEYSDMNICALLGFLTYFFMIASFFWMNAISIQILLSMSRPVVNNYSWKVFSWYALYAWGCPIILTVCMAIVNFHPGDHPKPGIGLMHCWFFSTKEQWHYLYSVMTVLILLNIFIFIYTSLHIWRLTFSSNHVKALKYKFKMTLHMFIIMGLPWIFEMISSVWPNSIWYVADIFNMLQGILIFLLLVVLRRRVVKALLKRGLLDCIAGSIEKYLAIREDDEEGVMQHTIDVTLAERNGIR